VKRGEKAQASGCSQPGGALFDLSRSLEVVQPVIFEPVQAHPEFNIYFSCGKESTFFTVSEQKRVISRCWRSQTG